MLSQFIGKPFWIVLGALGGVFVLAVLAFQTPFVPILLALIGIGVFLLTVRKLEWGLAAAFAELFANSHGHLLSVPVAGFSLSLRMVVFFAVLAAWLFFHRMIRRVPCPCRDPRFRWFFPLLVAVVIGFIVGVRQQDPRDVFQDGNAYFYLAYLLPLLNVSWGAAARRLLIQTLSASAAWVSLLTLGLLYVFTHFPVSILGPVYTFIRDTRTGELTDMGSGIFRVFLQSQFSVALIFILLISALWMIAGVRKERAGLSAALAVGCSILLISLSRSFWIGLTAGGLVLVVLFLIRQQRNMAGWQRFKNGVGWTVLAGAVGSVLLVLIILFPYPYRVGSADALSGLFSSRTTDAGDVAVSSRWKLLPPMVELIRQQPITGNGFGQEVQFQTDDPRVRAFSPEGWWSTYALEWGWFELWLKMGILGPLSFLFLLFFLVRGVREELNKEHVWMANAFVASLVMLYATHTFSPYLNHPLGLGFLLFLVPFAAPRTLLGKPIVLHFPKPQKMEAGLRTTSAASFALEKVGGEN